MPPTITVPQAQPAPKWQRVRAAWSDIHQLLSLPRRGGIPMVFIGMTEWFSRGVPRSRGKNMQGCDHGHIRGFSVGVY